MKRAKKKKEDVLDVLGVFGEVHNVPHVCEEKMTSDVLVERESSDDFLCSDNVLEGLVPYRKPIIQDVQIYQTPQDCVQKSSNVQIQKGEEPQNQKRKRKKKNKNKIKKIWMPKVQVPNACEKMLEVGEKRKEYWVGLMKLLEFFVFQLKSGTKSGES
uniref:Uncharacterized protein n=1 Tax=Lactuca sativa TaxID=4236 RepID=A0A9R1VDG9_LACSA|nr:hypothetical protein LSAT_V11C500259270 [Lactuca sativa]